MIKKIAAISAAFAASCALVACAEPPEGMTNDDLNTLGFNTDGYQVTVDHVTCTVSGAGMDRKIIEYNFFFGRINLRGDTFPMHEVITYEGQQRLRGIHRMVSRNPACPAPVFLIEATPPQPVAPVAATPETQTSATTAVAAPAPAL